MQQPVTFQEKSVYLAEPRGFCAGVDRAIEIVERSLKVFGAPVYVRHEIVHNKFVVEKLKVSGAIFIEEVDDAPDGSLLIFSAHGVSKAVKEAAQARHLKVIDATCPLVTKVHLELLRHYEKGYQVILIGHAGHPEVEGTMGQAPEGAVLLISAPQDVASLKVSDPDKLAFVTQTTLSVDDTRDVIAALQQHFPNIIGPKREDICYATSNRQSAVKALAQNSDIILVIGSKNSSNSNRLKEVAERQGCEAHLIDSAADIDINWLSNHSRIGITAGASAPEVLVNEVISYLNQCGFKQLETLRIVEENVSFSIPPELK
ncbi:MAG: 4-hydroxy-3-methylbut-2-enyl diphosphate reductase [Zetaproteobacteria bacterium CG_4_9_14_3_um_filter_49_83]|nr:MAG: 4-hydroxy-3-methylbut-2-enyl diphosphate reductase [Zetaproteobacteria bacterium CG1_02_49_23]PIQ31348.1 MAG: 4-hydroxy-3-methylbut-2-enyl diphosphate reductase [Zetaproteobacteria bacterium CG17_big_fil_post_rev_8_21_14_2_50_50_13]PIV31260.1 MAG: 4-hydroxy-3-methylbut-2-enyl diphosphate reductase [Zetaproteobacteria bacterium CG02_land_8_20_14_3_00_50_9]PIY55378.1 MAG: 4-hydroxy-3-methylbut-2-enyl diphosphate reductase [Zetaproteobacteria bacterium CG_4_10_14_0_8_um_filter_49_80]PJA349